MGQKLKRRAWGCILKSIITADLEHCIICGKPAEKHHCFGSANRHLSTKDGLILPLCPEHHRDGENAVHRNADMALMVHMVGELSWIRVNALPFEDYESAKDRFRKRYGKNYL